MSRDLLIIDDQDDKRTVIRMRLEAIFDKINVASTLKEGLEIAKSHFYEFILLDINLPDANGIMSAGDIKVVSPDSEIILETAYKRIYSAAELMRDKIVLAIIDTVDDMKMLPDLIELKRATKELKSNANN